VQRYVATWRDPALFGSQFGLMVSPYYWEQVFPQYTESRLGGRITLEHELPQHWSARGSVRIEDVGVHNVVPWDPPDYTSVVGDHFLLGLSGSLTRDTRDSYLRPTEGSVLKLSFEEVTGDFTFPVASVDFSKYWTTHKRDDGSGRQVLAYYGLMRWEGAEAPVYERFFAGGFLSLRGFQYRGVSPQVNGVPVGGQFELLNRLEYQVPVLANDHIYFVAFADTGTVERRLEIKDYRVSVGFGVRLVVPQLGPVPLALDFGFPIVKGPGDEEQVVSFYVGFHH
jgi:outer membrane protein assembly factor BamA